MKWQALVILIYALFILAGGMMGYMKAHSHMSLIMGSTAGIILVISSIGIYNTSTWGLVTAFTVTTLLTFFFGYRYYITQAIFPSGVTTILSAITLLVLSFLPRK